jgi:hypothetical protein
MRAGQIGQNGQLGQTMRHAASTCCFAAISARECEYWTRQMSSNRNLVAAAPVSGNQNPTLPTACRQNDTVHHRTVKIMTNAALTGTLHPDLTPHAYFCAQTM